ncbi:PIR protein [Plasmodium sp. DRC-Itaito]|nr:PIR protein [Plasmodium sp. DRC-Itaito]
MKLHYFKILLFFILLNILVNTHHNSTSYQSNRSLCECDTQWSNYNKDEDMKSVRESFDRQTSQRFEEYKERLKEKRQKRKEERDKNIQEIIKKDKREKSLTEKVEKGCLRCGCGLGGVAASVGLFGGLGVYGAEMAAATVAAKAAGIKKGLEVGLTQVIHEVKQLVLRELDKIPTVDMLQPLTEGISGDNLTFYDIIKCIKSNIKVQLGAEIDSDFFSAVNTMAQTEITNFNSIYETSVKAVANAVEEGKAAAIAVEHAKYTHLYNAIGYSFLAILIIVLVMIIIYLVLRYRRKKKMKKKDQYTKLLNQ